MKSEQKINMRYADGHHYATETKNRSDQDPILLMHPQLILLKKLANKKSIIYFFSNEKKNCNLLYKQSQISAFLKENESSNLKLIAAPIQTF